jgi:hypothetical protein
MKLLAGKDREIAIISIMFIIILSNGLLFYFQNLTENEIRNNLFEQEKERQIQATREITQHVGSDISLVMGMLDGLGNSIYLQQGQLSSDNARKLLQEKYVQFNNTIDRLFILNKDNIMTLSLAPTGSDTFLNSDFSFRDWVIETRSMLHPVFSGGFESVGVYREFITIPIINRETNQYIGIAGAAIRTENFFAHYGNINDINSQFLVAYDKDGIMLANGANRNLVGQNFFEDTTQQFIRHNEILNNLTRNLLAGNPGAAVYDYGNGERLTTQYPILVDGKPTYYLQIVTPTSQIYSVVNNVLSMQNLKMFSLFGGASTIAIVVLAVLLRQWNVILKRAVKRRTMELEESFEEMKHYLEQVLKEVKK